MITKQRGSHLNRLRRYVPMFLRLIVALGVLGLFIWACLSSRLVSNGVLALLAKGQFSAALYGTGILGLIVIAVLGLTLVFGRFYCSVLCPLGTLQEIFWRIGLFFRERGVGIGDRGGGKQGMGSRKWGVDRDKDIGAPIPAPRSPPPDPHPPFPDLRSLLPTLRYLIPLMAGVGAACAFFPLMLIFDPISTFGRGMGAVRAILGGNAAIFTMAIALPLALILVAAVFRGRAFCNWCPVGLTLGLFSSAAPFGMKISSRCVSCGRCEKKCPAGCLDSRSKRLDAERCVLCFSCTAVCPSGSVGYGFTYNFTGDKTVGSRREFLKGAGKASLVCGAAYLLGPSLKLFAPSAKGSASVGGRFPSFILPPGAKSWGHYSARCIGCQACADSCPVGVIKIKSTPQPVLDYTGAGCQFNCVECGKVCPTGAIRRLDVEEKHRTRVALSTLYFERCVVNTRHESCGACAEVCPTGAITMTAFDEPGIPYLTRPVFDDQYCIGCGACFAACPALPRAFTLAAVTEQTLTAGPRPPEEAGDELRIVDTEDFPF